MGTEIEATAEARELVRETCTAAAAAVKLVFALVERRVMTGAVRCQREWVVVVVVVVACLVVRLTAVPLGAESLGPAGAFFFETSFLVVDLELALVDLGTMGASPPLATAATSLVRTVAELATAVLVSTCEGSLVTVAAVACSLKAVKVSATEASSIGETAAARLVVVEAVAEKAETPFLLLGLLGATSEPFVRTFLLVEELVGEA